MVFRNALPNRRLFVSARFHPITRMRLPAYSIWTGSRSVQSASIVYIMKQQICAFVRGMPPCKSMVNTSGRRRAPYLICAPDSDHVCRAVSAHTSPFGMLNAARSEKGSCFHPAHSDEEIAHRRRRPCCGMDTVGDCIDFHSCVHQAGHLAMFFGDAVDIPACTKSR
jgi:hypothetical protein